MDRLGTGRRGLLRRTAGLAAVLAGLAVGAPGLRGALAGPLRATGVAPGAARTVAGAAAALVVPAVLVALLALSRPRRRSRSAGAAAALVAGVGVAVAPFSWPAGGVLYAVGLAGLVASLAATAASVSRTPTVSWRAADDGTTAARTPADGGTDEDDMRFPLDEE